jgi:hypothetical protein
LLSLSGYDGSANDSKILVCSKIPCLTEAKSWTTNNHRSDEKAQRAP